MQKIFKKFAKSSWQDIAMWCIIYNEIQIKGVKKMQEYISVSDFCKMFGISRQAVQKKIKEGKMVAVKFGNKYLISNQEVQRIKMNGVK